MKSLIAVAGITAVGLVAALPATGAPLGVQDDQLTSGPIEAIPSRMDLLKRSGTKITRVDVLWSLAAPTRPAIPTDPADPAYQWQRLDAIMTGLAANRITPILVAYSAPTWAVGGRKPPRGSQVNANAPKPGDYAKFMQALATRYSGAYIPPGALAPLPRARHYEVWNEPNLKGFLSKNGRTATAGFYASLTRAAYPAIKRGNRAAIVIGGVGAPRSTTGPTGTGAIVWAKRLAASSARFDAYSQHVYPFAPPKAKAIAFPSWITLGELPKTLDAVRKRRGMPIYITEAGYTTASTRFRRTKVSNANQARYLKQIMRLPVLRSSRYRAVIWFNLQDNPDWPGGLLNARGGAKPSYRAFVPIAKQSRVPTDLRFQPTL